MLVPPATFGARGTSLINTLSNLGLLTNLKLCLDAGDLNSYDGSSQTWKDLSGNGTDFYRGSGSGSDGADPTYNGTAGRQSSGEYFSYDGADYFTLAQSAPSWQSSFHKAGAKFTFLSWQYINNITAVSPTQTMFDAGDATDLSTAIDSISLGNSTSAVRAIGLGINNTSGSIVYAKRSTSIADNNAWNFLGISADFSTGSVLFQVNGTTDTFTGQSLSSPSTADSHHPFQIGSGRADGSFADESGCRIANYCVWDIGLTGANMLSIFNATRSRFGI